MTPKTVPKIRTRTWIFPLIALLGCLVVVSTVPYYLVKASRAFREGHRCRNDSLLVPNLTFGNLTITQARAIDVGWNLVVGRGGQGILGFASYRASAAALVRIAERTPVSYDVFGALSLQPQPLEAIVPLLKSVLRTTGARAKITLGFLLLSAIFVLAFPSICDIEAGYIQKSNVLYQFPNGTIVQDPKCQDQFDSCHRPLEAELVCVPAEGYEWGFAAELFFLLNPILIGVFGFGLYGIWVDANVNSVLQRSRGHLGQWRVVVDLAGAIHQELGLNLGAYSNTELKNKLERAAPISYEVRHDYGRGLDNTVLRSARSRDARTGSDLDYYSIV